MERKSASDWVSACRSMVVKGVGLQGRGKKSWTECMRSDMKKSQLKVKWAQDREMWGSLLSEKRPNRASMETRMLK